MKKSFNKAILFIFLVVTFTFAISCSKQEEDPDLIIKNSIELSGTQEVPAVSTSGSGLLHLHYKRSNRTLIYTITWVGLTSNAVSMHFHGPAGPNEIANPVIPITGFAEAVTGSFSGSAVIDEGKVNDFLSGKWYLNIHTINKPTGEIRGQIVL